MKEIALWEGMNELVRLSEGEKFYVVEIFPRALCLTIWDISEFHFPDYLLADLDRAKGIVVAKSDMDLWEELTTHHLTQQGFSWVGREIEVAGLFFVVLVVHSQVRDLRRGDWFIPPWQSKLDESLIRHVDLAFSSDVFKRPIYEISLLPFEEAHIPEKIVVRGKLKKLKHLTQATLDEIREVRETLSEDDVRYAWVRLLELSKKLCKEGDNNGERGGDCQSEEGDRE